MLVTVHKDLELFEDTLKERPRMWGGVYLNVFLNSENKDGCLHAVFNDIIIIWGRCSQDAVHRSQIIKKQAMQYSYNLSLHLVLQVVSLRILARENFWKFIFQPVADIFPPLSWATFNDSSSLFQAGSSQ